MLSSDVTALCRVVLGNEDKRHDNDSFHLVAEFWISWTLGIGIVQPVV